jgi:hypothetical protein
MKEEISSLQRVFDHYFTKRIDGFRGVPISQIQVTNPQGSSSPIVLAP